MELNLLAHFKLERWRSGFGGGLSLAFLGQANTVTAAVAPRAKGQN